MHGMNGAITEKTMLLFVLGRLLGPKLGEGNEIAQWILKANGKVLPRQALRPLKTAKIYSPVKI
jgi:hypothetical protein